MIHRLLAALPAVALFAGAAAAQDFRGAELSVEALAFDGDDSETFSNYRGAAEVGIPGGFGIAADLSFFNFGDDEDGIRNLTVHGLTEALPLATWGLFYARDSADDSSSDTFGVEAGRNLGGLGIEAYLGFGDEDDEEFRLAGFDGTFDLGSAFAVTGSGALLDTDGGNVGRLSVGGEFRFAGGRGPALYAEVGRIGAADAALGVEDGSTFVGVGARIAIGANRGTTFGSRGLGEVVGGF